jgi:PhzF family phenazine biosynthesis protein
MNLQLHVVDAFTDRPFKGNPAAVCNTPEPLDEDLMQKIAAEMNLSETAFLYPNQDSGGYTLRWFTPAAEVDLCGHATLASAHILWQKELLRPDEQAVFHTKSGRLSARLEGSWIELNFPAEPAIVCDAPPSLMEALQVDPVFVGRNRMDYIVEIESEDTLIRMKPNFSMLGSVADARGVIVTSKSARFDFISRCFFPAIGVNEDPVTGSAHSCLAPYWSKKLGKREFIAFQASARGGLLKLRLDNDRVLMAGQAVTVLKSEMNQS